MTASASSERRQGTDAHERYIHKHADVIVSNLFANRNNSGVQFERLEECKH